MKLILRSFLLLSLLLSMIFPIFQSAPTWAWTDWGTSVESKTSVGSQALITLINTTLSDLDKLDHHITKNSDNGQSVPSKEISALFYKITDEVKQIVRDPLADNYEELILLQWPYTLTTRTECSCVKTDCSTCKLPPFNGWDCSECSIGTSPSWPYVFWQGIGGRSNRQSPQEISPPVNCYPVQWVVSPFVYWATCLCNGGSLGTITSCPQSKTVADGSYLMDLTDSLKGVLLQLREALQLQHDNTATTTQPSALIKSVPVHAIEIERL